MKILKGALVLGIAVGLSACPADRQAGEPLRGDAPEPPPPVAEARTAGAPTERIALRAMNQSGITGEAVIGAGTAETRVGLTIQGAPPNQTLGTRLRAGRCDDQGPEVAPLEPVRTNAQGVGQSASVVELPPPHEVFSGRHYLQVHATNGELGPAVACGDIPARADLHPGVEPR